MTVRDAIQSITIAVLAAAIILLGLKVERLDRVVKHEIQSTAIICTLPTGTGEIA